MFLSLQKIGFYLAFEIDIQLKGYDVLFYPSELSCELFVQNLLTWWYIYHCWVVTWNYFWNKRNALIKLFIIHIKLFFYCYCCLFLYFLKCLKECHSMCRYSKFCFYHFVHKLCTRTHCKFCLYHFVHRLFILFGYSYMFRSRHNPSWGWETIHLGQGVAILVFRLWKICCVLVCCTSNIIGMSICH